LNLLLPCGARQAQFRECRATFALGQQRTWRDQIAMSALPPIADIPRSNLDVSFGPILLQKSVAGFFGQ
jgi:hypothetical protein